MDRWMLPLGLTAWAAELCWGIRGGERLNWRFIYPIHCQGQLVLELACVFTKCQNLDALFYKNRGDQWPLVASRFKLPAPLKAVLTGHYSCLLKTKARQRAAVDVAHYWHKCRHTNTERQTQKIPTHFGRITRVAVPSGWCSSYKLKHTQ